MSLSPKNEASSKPRLMDHSPSSSSDGGIGSKIMDLFGGASSGVGASTLMGAYSGGHSGYGGHGGCSCGGKGGGGGADIGQLVRLKLFVLNVLTEHA